MRRGRFAAVVALVVVLGGIAVFAGGGSDDPAVRSPSSPAGPDEPGPDDGAPDEPGSAADGQDLGEVRPDDEGAGDVPVVPASTAELPEDTYCWWDGADPEKCDVWAVDSARSAFSHVVAAGERVIVAVRDAVVALDGSDGAVLWTWRDEVPTLVDATPDRVFVTDDGGRTVALDAATGNQVWDAELREGRWLRQSIRNGVVVNREPSSMVVFAADDGALRWERSVQAAVGDGTPVITGKVVVTAAGEELVGFSLADGEQLWQAPLSPTLPPVHWPGGEVVVVAEEDRLSAVDIATGSQLWTGPAEGVAQIADVDADTIAVARAADRVDLVDRHTGATVTPVHAPELRAIQATGDGQFFSRVGGSGVKLWRTEPLGPTWNLHVWMPGYATYATVDAVDGETYLVAPIDGGTTVAAFRVSERDRGEPPSEPACDGAQRSWHLGGLTAWAGAEAHAAIVTDEPPQQQLWIGIPGQSPDATTTFTVSARPLDTTGQARFSHSSDVWRQEIVVDSPGRVGGGFPPHWVVTADFPQPGCWEIQIVGDQIDHTVIIPVPATNDVNG